MFIQSMTSEELLAEYLADLPELQANDKKIDSSPSTSRLLEKNYKSGKLFLTRITHTKRMNSYLTLMCYTKQEGSRRFTKWLWESFNIGLMDTPKGKQAISFFVEDKFAITYQAHFFVRYKERYMDVCDWKVRNALIQAKSITDIMAIYFRRNRRSIWVKTNQIYGDKEHVFAPITDGVALLQWNGKTIQANTFITEGMYSEKQKQLLDVSNAQTLLVDTAMELFKQLAKLQSEQSDDKPVSHFFNNKKQLQ